MSQAIMVSLPAALVRLFPGCNPEVTLQAGCVADMIRALDARWPGMADRLCESPARLRRHINVFVGTERASLQTPLPPGAAVLVMTAISGG